MNIATEKVEVMKPTDAQVQSMVQALKEIFGTAENGNPYSPEELLGPDFSAVAEIVSTFDETNPDRIRERRIVRSQMTSVQS